MNSDMMDVPVDQQHQQHQNDEHATTAAIMIHDGGDNDDEGGDDSGGGIWSVMPATGAAEMPDDIGTSPPRTKGGAGTMFGSLSNAACNCAKTLPLVKQP